MQDQKISVEIWSDVMCPFCYIGKRKFETALARFEQRESVVITWKSFQLNPSMKTNPDSNINEYLASLKGWTLDYARQVNAHVTAMAKEEGLTYDFDKAIVANSFDAHRMIQLAKKHGKGDAMEELLFRSYFSDGLNTADHTVLRDLAVKTGLDSSEAEYVLETGLYAKEVQNDVMEARSLGISGVPFFLFDRKFAISGAQKSELFLQALVKAREESIEIKTS
jgi:predicted DsbA family dithiol-disulfide isomerase